MTLEQVKNLVLDELRAKGYAPNPGDVHELCVKLIKAMTPAPVPVAPASVAPAPVQPAVVQPTPVQPAPTPTMATGAVPPSKADQ